ncbi:MAG TPA: hypothetical protein VHN20_05860 [Beijerinckiaceae bacterium]|nr:hypothetical protein [Beijerinckiaceae bacterium]
MRMGLVWIGALLVVAGVLFTAAQAIWRGRLSGPQRAPSGLARDTLEPPNPAGGFSLRANLPGLAMIAFGALLLLVGAVS